MKPNRHLFSLLALTLGLGALPNANASDKDQTARAKAGSPASSGAVASVAPEAASNATIQVTVSNSSGGDAAVWPDIKTYTYDQRSEFMARIQLLEADLDGQLKDLPAARLALRGDTTAWDFAMATMRDARDHLKSARDELDRATPESWAQQKDKVCQAWDKTQEAYGKLRSSTVL